MVRMMTRRAVLPFMLALAVLAVMAVLVYWQPTPVAAQSGGTLAAPTVELVAASACNPKKPRTYLVASYTAVEGASSYEYRVKWGRAGSLGKWRAVPSVRQPDTLWAVYADRFVTPGETYVVQVRAVDANGVKGPTGAGRYSYQVSDFPAPDQVQGAYAVDGDDVDYTRARLTWRGSAESGGWFWVQQRAIGGKWQSDGWRKSPRVGGDGSPYYLDLEGLDPAQGYEFRVAGHSAQCEASPWSEVATLWQIPDAPEFRTSVGKSGDGAMIGVWVADPYEGADYHTFRIDEDEPAGTLMPAAQRRFPVKLGQTYSVCVAAGNARGESEPTCRSVTARVTSPIDSLRLEPGEQMAGTLDVLWDLIPVVNPTWYHDDEGSTHAPPGYSVVLREVETGLEIRSRHVFQEGPSGGARFKGLKGNTEYEVAVRSAYYGETEYVKATGRTLMHPARNLAVGFVDDEPRRVNVEWEPPSDGSQVGYVVVLRKTFGNKRVGIRKLDAAAVGATFDGLRAGQWYHVNVKAIGEGAVRSAVRTCYFRHGTEGSQNRAGANMDSILGSGCVASPEE